MAFKSTTFTSPRSVFGLLSSVVCGKPKSMDYGVNVDTFTCTMEDGDANEPCILISRPDIQAGYGWPRHAEYVPWEIVDAPTDIYPDELPTDFHPQLRALVEKNNRDVAPPERDKCGGVIEQFEILIFDLDEDSDGGHVFGEVDDNSELVIEDDDCDKLAATAASKAKFQVLRAGKVVYIGELPGIEHLFVGKHRCFSIIVHDSAGIRNDGVGVNDSMADAGQQNLIGAADEAAYTSEDMESLGMLDSAGAVDEYLDELLHSPQHAAALDTPDKKESLSIQFQNFYKLKRSQLEEAACKIWDYLFQGDRFNAVFERFTNRIYTYNDTILKAIESAPKHIAKNNPGLVGELSETVKRNLPVVSNHLLTAATLVRSWTLAKLQDDHTYKIVAEGICTTLPPVTFTAYCLTNTTLWMAPHALRLSKSAFQVAMHHRLKDSLDCGTSEHEPADAASQDSPTLADPTPPQSITDTTGALDDYGPWAVASENICSGVRKACSIAQEVLSYAIENAPKWVGKVVTCWRAFSDTVNSSETPDVSGTVLEKSPVTVNIDNVDMPGAFPQDPTPETPATPVAQALLNSILDPKPRSQKVHRASPSCNMEYAQSVFTAFNSGIIVC